MIVRFKDIVLTDEHSASSYGIPVALIGGEVYGPRDLVAGRGHAAGLIMAEAATARVRGEITTDELRWCERFWR